MVEIQAPCVVVVAVVSVADFDGKALATGAPLQMIGRLRNSIHRISQRLHGITSVTQAMLL
jgi:hypothetical protein